VRQSLASIAEPLVGTFTMHRDNRRSLPLGYEILSEGFVMVLLHRGSPKGGRTQRRPLGRLPQRHRIFSLSICAELAQSIETSTHSQLY
jgi:hypothetical protein